MILVSLLAVACLLVAGEANPGGRTRTGVSFNGGSNAGFNGRSNTGFNGRPNAGFNGRTNTGFNGGRGPPNSLSRLTPPTFNRDGTVKQCDTNGFPADGCGQNADCLDSCIVSGLKECVPRVNGRVATRNCGGGGGSRNLGSSPVLNILDEGAQANLGQNPLKINFTAALTLVQARGKNILVDTGTIPQVVPLLDGLSQHGLRTSDVDYVFTTHGHPDHYANVNLFPDAQQHFSGFEVFGYQYNSNPLLGNQGKLFVFDNPDLEVINTPGHTPQDTSLIVKNAQLRLKDGRQVRGTVGVVGDLFLSEQNAQNPKGGAFGATKADQLASMTTVACQVDWIIPGHGPAFDVRPYKRNFSC